MKTFLFDLDGTILELNWEVFEKLYYGGLAKYFAHLIEKDKIIPYIYASYQYMVSVTDDRLNKEKFYDKLTEISGVDRQVLMDNEPIYYIEQYDNLQSVTTVVEEMVESVRILKAKGYPLIIASQPAFPAIATRKRISWTGLSEDDFLKVTNFENSYASKPSIEYYQQLLDEFNLKPQDCIMVGNNRQEDMMITELGVEGILITDYLIDSDDEYPCKEMSATEFLAYVKEL